MLRVYAPGFVIRAVNVPVIDSPSEHWPMRISTHLWHNATDADRLIDAMWDLSRKRPWAPVATRTPFDR